MFFLSELFSLTLLNVGGGFFFSILLFFPGESKNSVEYFVALRDKERREKKSRIRTLVRDARDDDDDNDDVGRL